MITADVLIEAATRLGDMQRAALRLNQPDEFADLVRALSVDEGVLAVWALEAADETVNNHTDLMPHVLPNALANGFLIGVIASRLESTTHEAVA